MHARVVVLLIGAAVVIGAGAYLVNKLGDNAQEVRGTGPGSGPGPSGTGGPGPSLSIDAPGAALDCAKPTGDAARVDDAPITMAALCGELAKLGGVKAGARAVLDRMIDDLLVKRALDVANLAISDAEVTAALQARGLGAPTPDQDPALLLQQMRARLELEKLVTIDPVTDKEVQAEIAAGAPGIDRGAGVRVEGWIIRVPASADQATRAKAEAAARAVSQTPTDAAAQQHGMTKLAPFVVGSAGLEPELYAAAAQLATGAFSGPVMTKVGIAVIKKIEDVEAPPIEGDMALPTRVRRALETRRMRAATNELLAKLRRAARIEILVGL